MIAYSTFLKMNLSLKLNPKILVPLKITHKFIINLMLREK
jgi:hypothetical protein